MEFIDSFFEILSNIYEGITSIFSFIVSSIEMCASFVLNLGDVGDTLSTVLGVFPYQVFSALLFVLNFYISVRILRFLTLQG